MKKVKKVLACLLTVFLLSFALTSCDLFNEASSSGSGTSNTSERPTDSNDVSQIEEDDTNSDDYTLSSSEDGSYTYSDESGETSYTFSVEYVSGTSGCYSVSENTLTFTGIAEDSVYNLSGTLPGNIVVSVSEDYEFELDFVGFTLISSEEVPIYIESADKVTIAAKKETDNYLYDNRDAVDEDGISGCVYALCDLDVQGKGNLYVKSAENNGIHTKKDLNVKNLTLQVECVDNALKGNDSVTVQSGTITLIATQGDGIKTTDSDVSSKGNQRGTVSVTGGTLLIYAACDGIDASYDVEIAEGDSVPAISIYTDKYSSYSEEVTATSENTYYIRYTSTTYSYSIRYYNDDSDGVWYNSSSYETSTSSGGGMGMNRTTYYYYPITKPSGYSYMELYVYSSSQSQGQSDSYTFMKNFSVNDNYDTIALTANRSNASTFTCSWTNYTTTTATGGWGGNMGMEEGNSDKGDYSTKGLKAANEIVIDAGSIQISSYDDAIHANCDSTLENGSSPLGNVTITGGTLSLYTNDDGIHADEDTTITGGTVTIGSSYEGIEGSTVTLAGGTVSVLSSDDGVNGTSTTERSITISGGSLYVYAGGDGLDSNTGASSGTGMGMGMGSSSSYNGMLISGGKSVIISTGSSESSLDTETGYQYTGGYVLGMDSGGMTNEATACSNFSSVGTKKSNVTLTADNYLTVSGYVTVQLPVSIRNAFVVFLGDNGASISTASSSSVSPDANGVYWNV